ncbi:MAG: P-loop NTPase [Chloroflexota bacterium]
MTKRGVPAIDRIVVVASGKGGVGKTTVTVNLAIALASLGKRVGLFDADLYGPNVPLMLGVTRQAPARAPMIPIARADPEPYIDPLERHGIALMSFGLLVGESDTMLPDSRFAGSMVERTLRDVKWGVGAPGGRRDILLIDLPPGSGEPQQTLVQNFAIDGVIAVTTPQDLSLMDTGRSIGLYRKAGIPVLGVVENMAYLDCPHCAGRIEVFHETDRPWAVRDSALPLLARLPMAPSLSRPVTPDAVPPAFLDLARTVLERLA